MWAGWKASETHTELAFHAVHIVHSAKYIRYNDRSPPTPLTLEWNGWPIVERGRRPYHGSMAFPLDSPFVRFLASVWLPFVFLAQLWSQPAVEYWGDGYCLVQVKNIATALDMYSSEHADRYPDTLSELTPNYLKVIPTCPMAGTDTYSGSYKVAQSHTYYAFCCSGHHHRYLPANYPCADSRFGSQWGTSASDPEVDYFRWPYPHYINDVLLLALAAAAGLFCICWTVAGGRFLLWLCLLEGTLFLTVGLLGQWGFRPDLAPEWNVLAALLTFILGSAISGAWVAWRSQGRASGPFLLVALWLSVGPAAYLGQTIPNPWRLLFLAGIPTAVILLPGLFLLRREGGGLHRPLLMPTR